MKDALQECSEYVYNRFSMEDSFFYIAIEGR